MGPPSDHSITPVTRRNIVDAITVGKIRWAGRMEEPDFLSRLYDLSQIRSTDHRYKTAFDDIRKHRELNNDWDDGWVFCDSRFNVLHAPDEEFLRFCCEMIHPVVRPSDDDVADILGMLNNYLAVDGWELYACEEMSGRAVFAARRLLEGAPLSVRHAKALPEVLSVSYISRQVTRMEAAIADDPELAIGTAKEFVETICKTILRQSRVTIGKEDLPQLVKLVAKELEFVPGAVSDSGKAAEVIRVLLSNLASVLKGLGELRNLHGSGHGKDDAYAQLGLRHARLAVGISSTLGTFLFETFREAGEP